MERSDLPEGQQSKDLAAIVAEVMHRALDAVDENWHLSCMEPDGDGSCAKGHYARLMLAEDVAPKVIEAVEARVRADVAEEIAREMEQIADSEQAPMAYQYRQAMRAAALRARRHAAPAESDVGALPDQAGTREHPEDRDAR